MKITHQLYDYLVNTGIPETYAAYINMFALLITVLILTFLIDYIIRKILVQLFSQFASKSKTNFDDILVKNKVPRNIAHIVPLIFALECVPFVFFDFQYIENIIQKSLEVFTIVLVLWIVRSFLNSLKDFFKT